MSTKTPTPTINIESTFADLPYLSGWVGTVDENGIKTPEVNAYIYVYINGFLLNPPSFAEGQDTYNNTTVIFSDINGNWSTLDSTGAKSSVYTKPGAVVTVKAKSRRKSISDLSIPYTIQGMPTPTALGVTGDFGEFRPPNDGESILYGKFSYWEPESFLKCNNQVFIYNDGYKIGEIIPNKILGTDAVFPVSSNIETSSLSLLVDGNTVSIPFAGVRASSILSFNEYPDGVRNQFTFTTQDIGASYRVYNNVRLKYPIDYALYIDTVTKLVTVTFSRSPEASDVLAVAATYSSEVYLNQDLFGIKDGNNTVFYLPSSPNINTLQVYSNGLQLRLNTDYTLTNEKYITFVIPPEEDTLLIADYQNINIVSPIMTNPVITKLNTTQYSLPLLTSSGNIFVFKNGLLQKQQNEAAGRYDGTYTLTYETNNVLLTFLPGTITDNDSVIVNYEYSSLYTLDIANYLNSTSEFQEYCINASIYSDSVSTVSITNNIIMGDGSNISYYMPEYSFETELRLFKNGKRVKKEQDFVLNENKIIFTSPNKSTDIISSIIQNYNVDVLVQDLFTTYQQDSQINLRLVPIENTVQVYKNGFRMTPFGNNPDYALDQNTIIFAEQLLSTDKMIVDFQRFNSAPQYSWVTPFVEAPDGSRVIFSFEYPTLESRLEVFKNGIKLTQEIDYTFLGINQIRFKTHQIPKTGDVLIADFYLATFNTTTNYQQLKLESPYPLELVIPPPSAAALNVYKALFGSSYKLDPGKDTDGEFLFYIRGNVGEWKYTNLDLVTRRLIPFNKGEHLSARAINTSTLFTN